MDSTPQPVEPGDAAIQRGEAVPDEWVRLYDSTPEAERVARLAADQELVNRVQLEGFGGVTWGLLAAALVAYGTQVIRAWVRSGTIFSHCRKKGFRVKKPPASGIGSWDVEELADETVAFAITRFKNEVLATGRWDPGRGASLKTFFIGMCLKQFPTTYTEWLRRASREAKDRRAGIEVCRLGDAGEPWRSAAAADPLQETLDDLIPDELTREVVRLRCEGYSQAEIAELLGVSEGAIESRLHRLRARWRGRRQIEGDVQT